MASSRESFSIGDIQCVAISAGTFSYPVEWQKEPDVQFVGVAWDAYSKPSANLSEAFRPH